MTDLSLVIMAAGMGSRYGGLKQIDPFGPAGELIIDYSIYDSLRAGFNRVVFVIKQSIKSDFREVLGNRIAEHCDIDYVFQETNSLPDGRLVPDGRIKPWGTGHATLICREAVRGPFAVINADDFYGAAAFKAVAGHLSSLQDHGNPHEYCMAGYTLKNTLTEHGHVARGVCEVNSRGYLTGICERTRIEKHGNTARYSENDGRTWTEIPLDSTVSMNLWGFTPGIFPQLDESFRLFLDNMKQPLIDEFFLPDVINSVLVTSQALVRVIPTTERWAGVTYREDRPVVEQYIRSLVRAGMYPEKLWEEYDAART